MKIDGNVDRAEKLLRADAQSKDIELRVAAVRQTEHFSSIADRIVPLLIKALKDEEPRVIRAATNALWSLHQVDRVDVSAAIPVIAGQIEKKLEPYHLHNRLVRFLDDRWEELAETAEEDLPESSTLVKNFPIENAAFRSFIMQRLDRGLGIGDGIAAARVMKAHGAKAMAIIDINFEKRSPTGKALLMKAMQHLPYLECYHLLLQATADQETVTWNIPRGKKGSEPLPPGSVPVRVCDEAFKHLRWRLRNWKPLATALGRRSMSPGTKITDRDKLIAAIREIWEAHEDELILPSYKMAQAGGAQKALSAAELKQLREAVLRAQVVSGTKRDASSFPRHYLIIPKLLTNPYARDPVYVLMVLRSILAEDKPDNARKAYAFANGLFFNAELGSKAAASRPDDYDLPIEQGGKTRRQIRVRQLENLIFTVTSNRSRPDDQLDFLGYAPDKDFKPIALHNLPAELQSDVRGFALNLFRKDALPFAYNAGLVQLVPKKRDNDASIRVLAAQAKGDKDLIELSWRVYDTDIKWVIGQNTCCLVVPVATFDSVQKFRTFLDQVYLMEDDPN